MENSKLSLKGFLLFIFSFSILGLCLTSWLDYYSNNNDVTQEVIKVEEDELDRLISDWDIRITLYTLTKYDSNGNIIEDWLPLKDTMNPYNSDSTYFKLITKSKYASSEFVGTENAINKIRCKEYNDVKSLTLKLEDDFLEKKKKEEDYENTLYKLNNIKCN